MKKTLLLVAVLFATSLMTFGQANKVWNVGNDPTNFPTSAGIGAGPDKSVYIDGLGIHTGTVTNANMGQVESGSKTFTSPTNSTAYTFANRFKYNGAGYSGAAAGDVTPTVMMPTQRYLSFQVSGNSTIYVIGASGSSGSSRNLFVTDGSALVGTVNFPDTPLSEGTFTYTGPAATLFMFCNAAINMYYISATNVVVSSVNNPNIHKTVVSEKLFDILGREISNKSKGLIIKRQTYDDGTTSTFKTYIKSEKNK